MIIYLKSKEEIDGFKEVGSISGKILNSILKEIKSGIKTKHLDEVARAECQRHNVSPAFLGYHGFPAAICVSINETLVHGIPGDYVIKEGDVVSIDFGAMLDGFIGDTAETIRVGEFIVEGFQPDVIWCCRCCLNTVINDYCIAEKKLSQMCDYIFKYSRDNGFSVPMEYGGHGIDRNKLHAYPYIPCHAINIEDVVLKPGMVLAIEPMFIKGKGETRILEDRWTVQTDGISSHCEHTILITEEKPIILTGRSDE